MMNVMGKTRTVLGVMLPALAIILAACGPTVAQTQYSDVPVLVAAWDEDKESIRRGSEIYRRIISMLRDELYFKGFRVVDEESVAVDQDWEIRDRRPKMDLLDLAKSMNRSDKATHHVRALVLFRVFAKAREKGGGARTEVVLRINGETYDVLGNSAIGEFEIGDRKGNAPANCIKPKHRDLCIREVVGKQAREIASDLGNVLATKLEQLREKSVGGGQARAGSGGAVTGDTEARRPGSGSGHGIVRPYTITLRRFERREALTIIGTMADEFPGYRTHTLMSLDSRTRRYSYITSAKPHKMEEWITILLEDMNFNPDKQVRIAIRGEDIAVEKIVPTDERPRSADEKARFR